MTLKIATIVGTRPHFIKMAPLSRELKARGHQEIVIHTQQHSDYLMSGAFFRNDVRGLGLPDIDYSPKNTHDLFYLLNQIDPNFVIIYGDTLSSLVGCFYARRAGYPVAHIEAGLRCGNTKMVEESIRIMVDWDSDVLFCPTKTAVHNLSKEGITDGITKKIYLSGDLMRECLMWQIDRIIDESPKIHGDYLLATVHRAENVDTFTNFQNAIDRICMISVDKNMPVYLPLHPRSKKFLNACKFPKGCLVVMAPVSYDIMVNLEQHASAIITDSGGVQREAHWLGKECILLRDETEWEEFDEGEIEYPSKVIVDATEEFTA